MKRHDELCTWTDSPSWQNTALATCTCALITRIRADERSRLVAMIEDMAFNVFVDTDGYKALKVHSHYEGMALAVEAIRKAKNEVS